MTFATRAVSGGLRAVPGDGGIMLATFDVPFDEAASAFAISAALESGRALIVANVVELLLTPMSAQLGSDPVGYSPELVVALLAPVERAVSLGIRVERLRVKSFRRVEALVEIASERQIRLLVLGPDRKKVSPRLYRKAATAVRERLDCLVWLTWEIPSV